MSLRRQRKHWRDELAPMTSAAAAVAVAPGSHDLLAADSAGRNGSILYSAGCRSSVSLQVMSSDLAVGFEDCKELSDELFAV